MRNFHRYWVGLAFALSTCFSPVPGLQCAPSDEAASVAKQESPPPSEPLEIQRGYRPLVAALHIHTQFSNGDFSVLELARHAHERKLDVVGFSDSFLTRVRYGIGPLKKLVSRSMSRPGVYDHGITSYLESVETAQSRYPDVVLLPGLEVAPYYRWHGKFSDDLRLLDFNRHLLVFGLESVSAIRDLPVIENETWGNTPRDWSQALGPASLILAGFILLFLRREKRIQLAHFVVRKRRRFTGLSVLFLLAGAAWLYDRYPFGKWFDPYSGRHDVVAYQRVIDYVRDRNGLTFWSYPEAHFADVIALGVRMITVGNPEDLWLVDRYQGFEGLYGDRITITEPGNVWDKLLIEYLKRGRSTWPSIITGIDFHFFKGGGWYGLDRGQTILWARKKDEASVLDALRQGRGYAVFQGGSDNDLTLRNYGLRCGNDVALSGETLVTSTPVTLTAVIDWNDRSKSEDAGMARLEVVRDGELVDRGEYPFPIRVSRTDSLTPGRHYYRIRVKYNSYEILSNPVFCTIR